MKFTLAFVSALFLGFYSTSFFIPYILRGFEEIKIEQKLDPLDGLAKIVISGDEREHGSGVFVSPNQVLTAKHVVRATGGFIDQPLGPIRDNLTVLDKNKYKYKVAKVWESPKADVAVITLSSTTSVYKGPIRNVECYLPAIGDVLTVAGHPIDFENIISPQVVIGYTGHKEHGAILSVTGMTAPGNSGGPAYDAQGNIVAIVSSGALYFIDEFGKSAMDTDINNFVPMSEVCHELPIFNKEQR